MFNPLTCSDCGARRKFVGFGNTKRGDNEIRIFRCDKCGLVENLEVSGRQAIVVERHRDPLAPS